MNEFVTTFEAIDAPWSKEEFEEKIRAVGTERYHDKHEFHRMLHGGKLNKGQVAAWALNRYCLPGGRSAEGCGTDEPSL